MATDISRRFGPDQATGVRFNAAHHEGDTAVDGEHSKLDLLAVGLDWHNRDVRLSADIGWQQNKLRGARPNASLDPAVSVVPRAPDASSNFARPWSYSNERDLFGTLRGEFDFTASITAWAAYGLRRSSKANSLANPTVSDASTGAASLSVLVDAVTGVVTDSRVLPWYLTALLISQPLHFSDFGGLPMQILWTVLDIVTIIVLASGLHLWLTKREGRSP